MSVCIGTFVAICSNFATAFTNTYGWSTWQCGLTSVVALIGAFVGVYGGGWLSDKIADWMTQRQGGIREPEMRLPTMTISLILCPVSLILYAVGIQNSLHWIVPVLGLGMRVTLLVSWRLLLTVLVGFVITQVSNIAIVYAIDAHRPIAGEVVVPQLSFKDYREESI
ncbi:hypothetical protein N7451_011706 [Penicillium sp. IBT 35674x]|nr:hypothetical protein N7451_011706 [Penicillium sp. IBT 35674x]